MMVSSEETIKNLRKEVLFLQLKVQSLNRMLEKNGPDLDETKRELIHDLTQQNELLRARIEELEETARRKDNEPVYEQMSIVKVDAECEPKMSSSTIDQLLQRSIILKDKEKQEQELLEQIQVQQEQLTLLQQQYQQLQLLHKQEFMHQKRQQQQQQQQQQHLLQQQQQLQQQLLLQQKQQQHFHDQNLGGDRCNSHYQTDSNQCPHMTQINQQNQPRWHTNQTTLARPLDPQNQRQTDRPLSTHDQMTADERESLDKLFELDGKLTTVRNRLRAVVLN